jgi:hypothetical protein
VRARRRCAGAYRTSEESAVRKTEPRGNSPQNQRALRCASVERQDQSPLRRSICRLHVRTPARALRARGVAARGAGRLDATRAAQ